MTNAQLQIIWVTALHEQMRLCIEFAPELATLLTEDTNFITVRRTQGIGNTPANGDFIEVTAILANYQSGLLIGLHRKAWVNWMHPAVKMTVTYSRFYTTLFGLPKDFKQPFFDTSSRVIYLTQWEELWQ